MILSLTGKNLRACAETVARILIDGGIAIVPTDTVYGIVCDAFNDRAIERVYRMKERSREKPFLVLLSSKRAIKNFTDSAVPKDILRHIPGALTLVVPLRERVRLSFTKGSVAIRIPNAPFLNALLPLSPPLIAPSANKANSRVLTAIEEIALHFEREVDVIVNAGALTETTPSTIYDVLSGKTLREGAVRLDGNPRIPLS